MSIPLPRIGSAEFTLRIADRAGPGDWLVLVTPTEMIDSVAAEVGAGLAAIPGTIVEQVNEHLPPRQLVERLRTHLGIVLLSSLERLSDDDWMHLDFLRSRLVRPERVGLVMSRGTAEKMVERAPNLASWIGGSIWELDRDAGVLSAEDRERRLQTLRTWSGLSDDEMLARAARRELPPEPEYAEWLFLLGKDDVLER